MIVIDASALTAIVLKEEGWEDLLDSSDMFLSVDLILKEAANAVWAAALSGRLSTAEAREAFSILREFFASVVVTRPQSGLVDQAFELALKHGLTVYDSIYVALAVRESLPLLTLDSSQARVAREEGIRVLP